MKGKSSTMDMGEKTTLVPDNLTRPTLPVYLRVMAYCGFIVACLEILLLGSSLATNVYVNDLKSIFNYTQTEVEIIVSAPNIGGAFSVLSGLVFDRFGPKLTIAIGLVLTSGSELLIWSSAQAIYFYNSNYLLLALYFMLTGFGFNFVFVAAQNVTLMNFDLKWRGKIIGLHNAIENVGAVMFTQIYYRAFITSSGSTKQAQQYDFPNYMLLLAICFAIVGFLYIIFSNYYRGQRSAKQNLDQEFNHSHELPVCNKDQTETITPKQEPRATGVQRNPLSMLDMLRDVHYIVYVVHFVLLAASGNIVNTNVTTSSRSLGFSQYDIDILPWRFVMDVIFSLITGIVLDLTHTRANAIMVLSSLLGILVPLLYITGGDTLSVFVLATLCNGAQAGITWICVPAEISARFGIEQFGRNIGFIKGAQTLFYFVGQYVFGILYDAQIPGSNIFCLGLGCVQYGYFCVLAMGFISLIVLVFLHPKCRRY